MIVIRFGFSCQSDADINESRSNGELVTPAAIKIG